MRQVRNFYEEYMRANPFSAKNQGIDIKDSNIHFFSQEVDGDIIIADSFRKKIKISWRNTFGSKALLFFSLAVFFVLIGKLYYLQIARGAEYYGAAEGNRIRNVPIIPARGVIFDSKGKRLAFNVPDFALTVVPSYLPKTQEEEDVMFSEISETLGIEHFDLVEAFSHIPRTSSSEIELKRGISQEQAVVLSRHTDDWRGISLIPVQQRTYSDSDPLSHIIGYTGKISENDYDYVDKNGYLLIEHVGKMGLEKIYQDNLRGVPGVQLIEVDSQGNLMRSLERKEPIIGDNLYLNIDSDLQDFVWNTLKETIDSKEFPGGAVIVMDPRNGAIRALASFPGFDNASFSRGISSSDYASLLSDLRQPLFNRAISGEYPSGSTIKIVIGSAALEEGTITRYTSVLSTGGIDMNGYWFPDWKQAGHGQINIISALAQSVNTFFYAIGGGYQGIEGLGVDRIGKYGRMFGLDEKSGIDLTSEAKGFLPSADWKQAAKGERWYLGDTYHLAIGQGDLLVTPLQVANFTAVIANGGTLYEPHIVDRIGRDYETAKIIEPVIKNKQVISKKNIEIIREGLRAVVVYGSARSLANSPVKAAGKTGTAQFSSEKDPHAWFTGFAPYDNPEIVVTVLIEQGKAGDITATPIARKIFEWYFGEKGEDWLTE